LLPLAPQVSQVGNSALIDREAGLHPFGFELADVVLRQRRRADVAGFLDRGRGTGLTTVATVSVIGVIPVALRQDS